MDILTIIRKKRDKEILTKEEINYFIKNYTNNNIPDYQASALLMAIYINGLTDIEATNLAIAMRDSGKVYHLDSIPGLKVDKHSTGGVGDTVSLVLAPMVASLGLKFAKMSGRGLGHTGGTIDKFESIPGFRTELKEEEFINIVNNIGVSIMGQSGDITPADKKIYALRDVTETVSNVGLIASSIMSKKLASGADIIVLDVKYGSGAFMKTVKDAERLATLMVNIGRGAGKKIAAVITSMDEPLGWYIGNRLEIYEVIKSLKGEGPSDLMEVVYLIGSIQLVLAGLAKNESEVHKMLEETITSGSAFNKFKELIKAQGGTLDLIDNPEKLLSAKKEYIKASKDGYLSKLKSDDIGNAARLLGAGRLAITDKLNYDVGIKLDKKIGDKVSKGDTIMTIYHNDQGLTEAKELLNNSYLIENTFNKSKLVAKIIK